MTFEAKIGGEDLGITPLGSNQKVLILRAGLKKHPAFSGSNRLKMIRFFVMAGLVPAIHVFLGLSAAKTWMPGTRPGMTKLSYKAPILLAAF